MKKNSILIIILIILIIVLSVSVYFFYFKNNKSTVQNILGTSNSDEAVSNAEKVESVASSDNIKEEDFSSNETYAVELTETYNITKGGVYIFTGEIADGYIYVNTKDSVKIILNNVKITNSNGPAIYIESSDTTYIELAEGSTNYLIDGSTYNVDDEDVNAALFSKDDFVITGTGTLNVTANYKDAIASKDDLKIESGVYIINAKDDGIRGKDSVVIENGSFDITANGDGIKSTNDTDSEKGYVYIASGTFKIVSEGDGIVAKTDLTIAGGSFDITSGGGASKATNVRQDNFRNFTLQNSSTTSTDETSTKGIKAENNIKIEGGEFKIDSKDDAIHSNNYIAISNGSFEISTGDDGMHADSTLIIENGTINITKSYEGLEAENITINGGNIFLVSSDDGINVAGGAGASNMFMQRGGMNNTESTSSITTLLTINGGYIYVNAAGDGLDSNGSIKITSGTTIVNGPTDNGNTALDYERECIVTGGFIVASGSSGMVEGISSSSTQGFINVNLSNNINAGDIITIKDSNGNEVFTYSASKNYSNLIVSDGSIKSGETYTIYTGVTTNSNSKNGIYELGGFVSGTESQTVVAGQNTSGGFDGGMQGGKMGRNTQNMMENGQMSEGIPEDMNGELPPQMNQNGGYNRQGGMMMNRQ